MRPMLFAAACAAALSASQAPAPTVSPDPPTVAIVSPTADSYLSGPVLLRAQVVPADAVTTVVFFADGTQVCAMSRPPFECEWNSGVAVIEHQIRLVVSLKAGGRIVRNVVTKDAGYTENVDVDVVQLTATVSKGGHFVRGLPRQAFHVTEDGVPQKITSFSGSDVPLDLVVAVDISGSMGKAMPELKAAVREFVLAIPEKDALTLLGFNDNIFSLARRATGAAERLKAVDRLAPWGMTALYDVLIKSIELVGTRTGRKAIVIFTDGEDQGSHASLDDALAKVQETDAAVFMIGQGRGTSQENLKKVMQRLAAPTGGRAVFTNDIDDLRGVFKELLEELSNQYLLAYEPANARRDGTWRTIKVKVDGHSQVRARQGYRAKSK